MAKLIKKIDGKKAYIGILSPEELEEANKLSSYVETYIPSLEKRLNEKYPNKKNKVYFAHEFGTALRDLVKKFDIKGYQEKIFWNQIRDFASKDENLADDRSENRMIYDYYYKLANYPLEDVKEINWSEWSQFFDIPSVNGEQRLIDWLVNKSKEKKIKRETFRELMTGIRLFSKGKDLCVFLDEQLYSKLDMIYEVTINKSVLYDNYFTKLNKEPSKARVENKKKYREKYFTDVFKTLKENKNLEIYTVCNNVFERVYNVK